MKILVTSPTDFEVGELKSISNHIFFTTGVGIAQTCFSLTQKLLNEHFDFVIQLGLAGAYNNSFNLKEVVVVKEDCFADTGSFENNQLYSLFDLNLSNDETFFKNEMLINTHPILKALPFAVARAATVNNITDDKNKINLICDKFNPEIETMEGAAFHYVCKKLNIPFLQIRAISNEVGQRDKKFWCIKEAIENLEKAFLEIISLIEQYD